MDLLQSLSDFNMDESVLSTCSSSSSLESSFLNTEDFVSNSLIMRAESLESLHDAMIDCEAEEFMAYKNTSALCNDLSFMGGVPDLCDVKFLVGQNKVPVYGVKSILTTRCRGFHNLILSEEKKTESLKHVPKKKSNIFQKFLKIRRIIKGPKSPVHEDMVSSSSHLTIEVSEFEPNVFNRIILFLQSGTISVDISNVIGVMNAADKFGIEDLRNACFKFAQGFINVQSILSLYLTTLQETPFRWTKQLTSEIFAFIDRYADQVFSVEEFERLPKDVAVSLLSRPIARASEETKWDAALRWSRLHSNGDFVLLKTFLKSFTPNINLLEITLERFLDEVTPLCSSQSENSSDVTSFCIQSQREQAVPVGKASRKSSMSSVCSDSVSSVDSGYTSYSESCIL